MTLRLDALDYFVPKPKFAGSDGLIL